MSTDLLGRRLPAEQLSLGIGGRVRQGVAPAPPKPPVCPECAADMAPQLNAFRGDDWTCPECGHITRSNEVMP